MNDNASLALSGVARPGLGGLPHRLVRDGIADESAVLQALADANRSGRSEIMKGSRLTVSTGFAP